MSCRRTRSFFPIAAVAMALSAANDGSVLIANRDKIGSFETFLVVDAGSGKSALKCIGNNKYVCAEKAGGASLAANRSRVGGRESFTYSLSQATTTPTPSDNLIKQAKASFVTRDTQVSINASPSDIVCIIMGASSGPGGSNPIGGNDMYNQGFTLINVAGDSDCKIEGWIKIWTGGSSIMIPRNAKDVGYGITVIDGSKARVNPSYLSGGKIATDNNRVKGLTSKAKDSRQNNIGDMVVPQHVGGSGLTLAGLVFDDPVLNVKVIEGNRNVPIYGFEKRFGDGDSFGHMVMYGDEINRMSGQNRSDYRTDYSEITINFDGWLIIAKR